MPTQAEAKAARIVRWFDRVDIVLNPCCRIAGVPGTPEASGDLGVFATEPLQRGKALATIPKSAVLSIVNTAAADAIKNSDLRGGLGLIFAILYERHTLQRKSKWHSYLKALPTREFIPTFWSSKQLACLRGTDLEGRPETDAPLLEEDFALIQGILDANPEIPRDGFTLDNYRAAASLVASRAFGVDDVHGMSLVPLADIFNHKCAYVTLSNDYVIEGASDSDSESGDGSSEISSESEAEAEATASEGEADGEIDRQQEGGELSEGKVLPAVLSTAEGADPAHTMEIAILAAERNGVDVLEIVATSEVAEGGEVHNTYGELSNCDLVQKYGFAVAGNPFDAVELPLQPLVSASEEHLGAKKAAKRLAFLKKNSDLLDEDDSFLSLLPGGRLEAGVCAILWCMFAASKQFKACHGMEDVVLHLQTALAASGMHEEAAAVEPMDIAVAARALPIQAVDVLRRAVLARDTMTSSGTEARTSRNMAQPSSSTQKAKAATAEADYGASAASAEETWQAQTTAETLATAESCVISAALASLNHVLERFIPSQQQQQQEQEQQEPPQKRQKRQQPPLQAPGLSKPTANSEVKVKKGPKSQSDSKSATLSRKQRAAMKAAAEGSGEQPVMPPAVSNAKANGVPQQQQQLQAEGSAAKEKEVSQPRLAGTNGTKQNEESIKGVKTLTRE